MVPGDLTGMIMVKFHQLQQSCSFRREKSVQMMSTLFQYNALI